MNWQDELKNIEDKKKLARKILGVSEGAGEMEIRKAFWLKAMECHPDKFPGDEEAQKKFKNIANAYEFLLKGKTGTFQLDSNDENAEKRIGEYLENEWGYFSWWRDSFYGDEDDKDINKSKNKSELDNDEPDTPKIDWW